MLPCQTLKLASQHDTRFCFMPIEWCPCLFFRNICLSNRDLSVFCLPLTLFPSTFPVTTSYSMPVFLCTCPKMLHCLFNIGFINFVSLLALPCTFPIHFHSLPSLSRISSPSIWYRRLTLCVFGSCSFCGNSIMIELWTIWISVFLTSVMVLLLRCSI